MVSFSGKNITSRSSVTEVQFSEPFFAQKRTKILVQPRYTPKKNLNTITNTKKTNLFTALPSNLYIFNNKLFSGTSSISYDDLSETLKKILFRIMDHAKNDDSIKTRLCKKDQQHGVQVDNESQRMNSILMKIVFIYK